MTAPPTQRRCRRVGPSAKWLLAAMLALASVLAPVEPPDLPGPLDDLYGAAPAHAQTLPSCGAIPAPSGVCSGTAQACTRGSPDPNDPSRCILQRPACAENPAMPGTFLTPSTDFPDFCEYIVKQSSDPAAYTTCLSLRGVVIKVNAVVGECRIIQSTRCEPGLHRLGFNNCSRLERRTWTCPAGTTRRNEFNTCFRRPPATTGTNPACGPGAPSFPIGQCEDYVDQDYVRTPGSVACSSYVPGPLRTLAANAYWCQYDSSLLRVDCHRASPPPDCTPPVDAECLKRASDTGGCSAIVHTINCRSLQAEFIAGTKTADDVYSDGCTPCVVLPFEPVSPDCPPQLQAGPWPRWSNQTNDAHRFKADFSWGDPPCQADIRAGTLSSACLNRPTCADPPRGQLVSESSHHSRAAVVNSPITLRVEGTPSGTRTVHQYTVTRSTPPISRGRQGYTYFEYAEATPTDPVIRTWARPDPGTPYSDVSVLSQGGECTPRDWPDFRVIVEELWPDTDETAIVGLFGTDSLALWRSLSAAVKRSRTEARGLVYIDSSTPPRERTNEITRRAGALTQELGCNHGADVWCAWTPRRSGFFRLTAVAGWHMTIRPTNRQWRQTHNRVNLENFFMNLPPSDGHCPYSSPYDRYYYRRNEDKDCILLNLQELGLTQADVGLRNDLSGLLPNNSPNNEWLYTDAAGGNFTCVPIDLRVTCGGGGEVVNYTESEPIGVLVHEVRVVTVNHSP